MNDECKMETHAERSLLCLACVYARDDLFLLTGYAHFVGKHPSPNPGTPEPMTV